MLEGITGCGLLTTAIRGAGSIIGCNLLTIEVSRGASSSISGIKIGELGVRNGMEGLLALGSHKRHCWVDFSCRHRPTVSSSVLICQDARNTCNTWRDVAPASYWLSMYRPSQLSTE